MKCPSCGVDNPEKAKFCLNCGCRLAAYCPRCGVELFSSARFCSQCGAEVGAPAEGIFPTEHRELGEQRKQVTILFADVFSFTAMSEILDAEEVNEMMNALWQRLDRVIMENGGWIDKHMGDAVMAVWGAETAREDDPEQAIRAALLMQREVGNFHVPEDKFTGVEDSPPIMLQMRLGIHTGPVLLSQVGTTGEFTAIGDTVNTASRLQNASPIGGVLISSDTYRHVRGLFDVQAQPPLIFKGKTEMFQTYVVVRAKPRVFKSGARGVEGIETRMVGRETEIKRLKELFFRIIQESKLQLVTIVGEAGVGKSRLLHEYDDWVEVQKQDVYYFKGRAGQEMQRLPYALLRDMMDFRFQILESDLASVVREKVEQGVAFFRSQDAEFRSKPHKLENIPPAILMEAAFMGQMLGFDFSDSPYLKNVLNDAQQIRDRSLIYLSNYFRGATSELPILMLLEDIHWADDSSLDLLQAFAAGLANEPIIIVCTARPSLFERRPQWGEGFAAHLRLDLTPLSSADSGKLVDEILKKVPKVPSELRELVVKNAEGNPYYLEELIKILIDDGVIVKGENEWQVEPVHLTKVRIPTTLLGVLQARLDSLNPHDRAVLQRASVVGRVFWDKAVAALSKKGTANRQEQELPPGAEDPLVQSISASLTTLVRQEMIFQRDDSSFADAQEYTFKHTILREVTYESVLKRLRRDYHAMAAEWLIQQSGERLGEMSGLIADHLELAGDITQAAPYLKKAGELAARQYANAEAVDYFTRAIALTPKDALEERYAILLGREKVYDFQGANEPQDQDLAELDRLAQGLKDPLKQAEVALHKASASDAHGDYGECITSATAAIAAAHIIEENTLSPQIERQAQIFEADGYWWRGWAFFRKGMGAESRRQLEQGLELARRIADTRVEANMLRLLGIVCMELDDYPGAKSFLYQALELYRKIEDRRGESQAQNNLGGFYLTQADTYQAKTFFEQALNIAREIGDRRHESKYLGNLGDIYSEMGNMEKSRQLRENALELARQTGDRAGEGMWLCNLGGAAIIQGEFALAKRYCLQALEIFRLTGQRTWETSIQMLMGRLLNLVGDYGGALPYSARAVNMAREAGHRSMECLCLSNMALIFKNLDEFEAASEAAWQALQVALEIQNPPSLGYAALSLGHIKIEQGDYEEAANAYKQARDNWLGRSEHNLPNRNLGNEARAGLARARWLQGKLDQALEEIEEVMSQIQICPDLYDAFEPLRVYLTCYQVLADAQDGRAADVLCSGYNLMMKQASSIEEERMRKQFFENVAVNNEIARLVQQFL